MQITRSSLHHAKGPEFTGDVYIDTVAAPTGLSRARAALVHFTPDARTAWYTHPVRVPFMDAQGACLEGWDRPGAGLVFSAYALVANGVNHGTHALNRSFDAGNPREHLYPLHVR